MTTRNSLGWRVAGTALVLVSAFRVGQTLGGSEVIAWAVVAGLLIVVFVAWSAIPEPPR